jgi:hypothetical protein
MARESSIEYVCSKCHPPDAFKGYDLDQSGFISRDELYSMFKAYFYLSMELVRDVVKALEEVSPSSNPPPSQRCNMPRGRNADPLAARLCRK